MRFDRGQHNGQRGAVTRKQGAERSMLVAQGRLGLGRLSPALEMLCNADAVLPLFTGQVVAQVPDRVRDRDLLSKHQQEDPCELKQCARHATSPFTSGKVSA